MLDRGLNTLIVATALIPSLVIALVLGIWLNASRLQDLDALARERGIAATTQLAVAARTALTGERIDRTTLQELAVLALEERGVRAISFYDRHGREIAHAGPRLRQPPSLHARAVQSESRQFVQPVLAPQLYTAGIDTAPIAAGARAPLGWVAMEYSDLHQTLSRYRSLLFGALIIAIAVIVTLALAAYTSRRFVGAVTRLRDAVQQIERGRLDQPLAFDDDRVLQQLADALNHMATHTRQAQIELQRSLEQTNRDLRESLDTVEVQNIELDLARREAIEASRIKSEFLANTSHELRTPLNGIIGFTKLLLKTTLEPRQRDFLETIRHSAESLLAIINDILDFSKIEAGKLVIDSVPFSLRDLIEDTQAILAPSAQEKDLQLTLDYAADVPTDLLGDPLRLRQILLNLIGNAIKFTPRGSVHVGVHLTAPVSDGRAPLEIEITDTGIGLSEPQQRQMFKPFAQADATTSRLFGGTGLGLAISKRLIEQMGGAIAVESAAGQGSTFAVTLRLQILNKLPVQKPAAAAPARVVKLPSLQVLAVDDNPTNLRLLALMLEELGVEPYLATGGQDALTLAQTHAFDLILLDIQMPEIDGREVARQLRNSRNPNCRTRLVALTAHVLPEEHRALLELGFDRCMTKPITDEQLIGLLAEIKPEPAPPAPESPARPVDLGQCLQRARNKPDLARDMLQGVLDMLPALEQSLQNDAIGDETLLKQVHKLHGACCYSGTPRLQAASLALEEILKGGADAEQRQAALAELRAAGEELVTWQAEHDLDVLFEVECNS
jgi:signal transduction histidine kinase/ActR/RegA family two-component response regulator